MPLQLESVGSVEEATRRLLEWLGALPADLPRRAVVMVPAERVAHALRRRVCLEEGCPGLLAGVRLLSPVAFARDLLAYAGVAALPGGDAVRRLRIIALFGEATLPIRYFRPEQLCLGRGYADAFAHAIADLENSGLNADAVRSVADDLTAEDPLAASRLRDIAAVWAVAEDPPSMLLTDGQVLQKAAAAVEEDGGLVAPFGRVLALLAAEPPASLVRFLSSIRGGRVLFVNARPLRPDTQRWRVAAAPDHAVQVPPPARELQLLQHFLFVPPEQLADRARPHSAGPDGSVDLEEYPSIEEEVDAAALWVAEQVSRGVAAEQVALIVPEMVAYARLLVDRLARIGATGMPAGPQRPGIAAHVAGGLRVVDTGAGVRLLALLRAWRSALDAESTVRILPVLRPANEAIPGRPLTPSAAAMLVYGTGIVGGSPGDAAGAREWLPRLQRRSEGLRRMIAELERGAGDEPEPQPRQRDRVRAENALGALEGLLPAVAALQVVAEQVIDDVPLSKLWSAVRAFVGEWYRLMPEPPDLMALLDERLAAVLSDPAADRVNGFSAVDYLIDLVYRERVRADRFGEPCVFIGTAAAAAGLAFTAVRVLGVVEGALPHTPHDDPIVPNDLRRLIEPAARRHIPDVVVPRIEDRVLEDVHGFFRVVAAAAACVGLSAPRQWVDRSEREVSGVMLEVATALGRPADVDAAGDGPSAARLRREYFSPGCGARQAFDEKWLALPRSVMQRLALCDGDVWRVPAGWCSEPCTALDRVHLLAASAAAQLGPGDGMLGAVAGMVGMPGVSRERAISASALTALWRCPYRFLLEYVVGLKEPARRPSTDTIDPRAYGTLFHAAAAAFFRMAGDAVCERADSLPEWVRLARGIASQRFDHLRDEYPLRGDETIERERERLLDQIEQLVRYEWGMPPRSFVGTELPFGYDGAVALRLPAGPLYVHGTIDRVDRIGNALSVRDLKTGRVYDFGEDSISAERDLQIGLYTLVLDAGECTRGHVAHAAYVHPWESHEPERVFRGTDLRVLRARTEEWMAVACGLLRDGQFPRTPNADDCRVCPFVPACGEAAQRRSAATLSAGTLSAALDGFWREKSSVRAGG